MPDAAFARIVRLVAARALGTFGRAVISAYAPGLSMGRVRVEVTAPGKPNEMEYKEFGPGIGQE